MKRLLSWLLALVMIISCLPLSALPAFAEEPDVDVDAGSTETTEEDFTVEWDDLTEGMESNPIDLTADFADSTATVTVPAGKTIYYTARIGGMIMSINGDEGKLMAGDKFKWPVFSITNEGAEDAEYVITVAQPVGTMDNPATLVLGENVATVAAGAQGYFYTYTAEQAGTLVLEIATNAAGWTYAVNNLTTYAYGDTQWSDSDPVVNPYEVEVAAGDELQIMVCTYDAANPWSAPAGKVTVNASYKAEEPEFVPTFSTSMQAYLELKSEVFLRICFRFSDEQMAEINVEDVIDNVGVLVWPADEFPGAENATYDNCDQIYRDTTFNDKYTSGSYKLGRFETRSAGIPAKELNNKICFRAFYITDSGEIYYGDKIVENYGVSKYCYNMLADSKPADDALMVALLNYGAQAQIYQNYNVDDLANYNLTEAQKADIWSDSLVRSDYSVPAAKEGSLARSVGSNGEKRIDTRGGYLELKGAINVFFYADTVTTSKKATIYYWTEAEYNSLDVLTLDNASSSEEMTWNAGSSRWESCYEGMAPKDMFNLIYACMVIEDVNGDVFYSGVVGYSPERYGFLNANKGTTEAALARRCVIYGDAARSYFSNN